MEPVSWLSDKFNHSRSVNCPISAGMGPASRLLCKYNSLRYKREKEILDYSKNNKIPTLGICHGMQMMSHFEGGKLKKIKNHVGTRHNIISKSKVDRYPQKVNSYHDYTIKKLPSSFDIICTCENGSIEAIKHKKYKWIGWMWHPERDKVFNSKLLKISKKFFKSR